MICKNSQQFFELNRQREKQGLAPLSRRQFCKIAAASSAAIGLSGLLAGCVPEEVGDGGSDYVPQVLGIDNRAEIEVRPDVSLDDYKCFGLTMLEPFSTDAQIEEMCSLDPPAIGNSCEMYSRGLEGKHIELEIVQMPPRKYRDAAPCQLRFYYVDDDGNPL